MARSTLGGARSSPQETAGGAVLLSQDTPRHVRRSDQSTAQRTEDLARNERHLNTDLENAVFSGTEMSSNIQPRNKGCLLGLRLEAVDLSAASKGVQSLKSSMFFETLAASSENGGGGAVHSQWAHFGAGRRKDRRLPSSRNTLWKT